MMKSFEKIIQKQKLTSANQDDIVIHVADNNDLKKTFKKVFS
jgi:hypothetical protein